MPAKKPASLIVRAETKTNRRRRADGEAALTPKQPLTVTPPAKLKGTNARAIWRETVGVYEMLDARIISVLDRGLLIDYCIAREQLVEMDAMRKQARKNYAKAQAALERMLKSKKDIDPKSIINANKVVNWAYIAIIKLDARVDAKRKMLLTMSQSLFLTPRSRAGVTPEEKQQEKPKSAMSQIIDG